VVELREEKKEELAGIDYVTDESDRTGMRALIRLKKDTDVDAVLKCLYKYTDLEVTFGINMVVIADGKPQQLGLMEIIRHYVKYQQQIVKRRTLFDLKQAQQRCHILEGLIVAVQNIDEVIAIIKKSESTSDARQKLMARFEISDVQAQAILDLRLARLTKLEIYKLEQELKELKKLIKKLTAISKSGELQLQVVIRFIAKEGEVEVAQVVVDGPATRASAGQMPAVALEARHVTLGRGVLVAPNHHGLCVLPKIEDGLPLPGRTHEARLDGEVGVRVRGVALHAARHQGHRSYSSNS
jgi:hypothetical protein